MSVNAAGIVHCVLNATGYTETLSYGVEDTETKDSALALAKNIIKDVEKEYDKTHIEGNIKRGRLDCAELASIAGNVEDFDRGFESLDLDGKCGLTKEELASYIMAADSLMQLKDPKYAGWEFLDGADINEEDLLTTVYSSDLTDEEITEDNIKALLEMDDSELHNAAKEIYDENFAKEDNPVVAFFKKIFC